ARPDIPLFLVSLRILVSPPEVPSMIATLESRASRCPTHDTPSGSSPDGVDRGAGRAATRPGRAPSLARARSVDDHELDPAVGRAAVVGLVRGDGLVRPPTDRREAIRLDAGA